MIELTKDNFDAEVKESDMPVLVDFWGPQCGPCKALMPQVEALEKEYEGKVKFTKVNVSGNRRVAIANKVMGLPAILFWKGGEEVARLGGGGATADNIKAKLEEIAG